VKLKAAEDTFLLSRTYADTEKSIKGRLVQTLDLKIINQMINYFPFGMYKNPRRLVDIHVHEKDGQKSDLFVITFCDIPSAS
jgi:hypothetical protein